MIQRKILFCLLTSLVLITEQGFSQLVNLSSPDKNIQVALLPRNTISSLVSYDLTANGKPVLKEAFIGFDLRRTGPAHFYLSQIKRKAVNTSWKTVYGDRNIIPENYNEVQLSFTPANDRNYKITITCRAYNEGFAFQYKIVKPGDSIVISRELSQFSLSSHDATAWASTWAQGKLAGKKVGNIKEVVERPLTIQLAPHHFMALGEAALTNFARMKFSGTGSNALVAHLDGEVAGKNSLTSPWRYVLCADGPANLLQKNYLLLNLNEPNKIASTSWIQPGTVLRESTLTTKGAFNCIDFASSHHIKYICFDAGWYGKEDADTSDATRVAVDPARSKGPLDLKKVIAYGKQKNVGVILYVNRRALERQMDTLFPLYESWGVKGVKFGFVQVGSQHWTNWLHEAIRKAAKHHLIVDIHDEYRPTGYTRTYPNLLTQEGIRGDEETPPVEHTITTLFTRLIAGPADNTICYFTDRPDKMGSHAAQIAKSVCIYSPLQFLFWYDRPVTDADREHEAGEIAEVPEMDWFTSLPTVWDDSKVLEGNMEEYATIARKKNGSWFIGSLNGKNARTVKWALSFLDKHKKYTATIYTDDPSMHTLTNVKRTVMQVDKNSVLSFSIAAKNGMAIRIVPKN